MDRLPNQPSPLELEQWLLAEQSPEARARTESRLDGAARAQLRHDDAELQARLFAALPPAKLAARLKARAGRPRREPSRRGLGWALATAASLGCVLLLVVRLEEPSAPSSAPSTERGKGAELGLRVYRSRDGAVEQLADGAEATAHDVLQLAYLRAGHGFGVLVSIDGRGGVTLHHPSDPGGSTALASDSGEQALPEAYELDDAPAFERFVLVAADRPLAVEEVLRAARALAADPRRARSDPLPLSMPSTQRSLLVVKPRAP